MAAEVAVVVVVAAGLTPRAKERDVDLRVFGGGVNFWKRLSSWVGRTDGTFRSWLAGVAAMTSKRRKYAAELVALAPDVILAGGGTVAELMLKATRTIPIVFAIVPDPVGAGIVERLSHPGGNATGFMMFEYNLCGKWLELFKEIAPSVTHAAVLRDPGFAHGIGQFAVIQAAARQLALK